MKRVISLATAKQHYPNRYTMEHMPAWARNACEGNGKFYAPGYRTDQEWYDNTVFPGEQGKPRRDDHCESNNQSWPLGQWLDKPYRGY